MTFIAHYKSKTDGADYYRTIYADTEPYANTQAKRYCRKRLYGSQRDSKDMKVK